MDLRKESRWEFLNTLFSVSEAVAYMQVFYIFTRIVVVVVVLFLLVERFEISVKIIVTVVSTAYLAISLFVACCFLLFFSFLLVSMLLL